MSKTKILMLRFSSIGDIVLTTPVVRALKEQYPNCEVHYCSMQYVEGILSNNPNIDKVHVLGDSLKALISTLKAEKFSYIIDLHNNSRTRIIKTALWNVKAYSFDKLNFKKWLLVKFKLNFLPNRHIVDRYFDAVYQLNVFNDDKGLDYFIPEKDIVEPTWLPETHRDRFFSVVIGGQHTTKKLPTTKLIELCSKINIPIILLGGKEDMEEADKIEAFFSGSEERDEAFSTLNKKAIIFNAVGKFNLNQSADLIRKSRAVFTHDTGSMHIAAAFKKEVFSIWGNTVPEFGMYPYQTKFTIFENKDLNCRPCSKIGFDQCPKGHFKCMKDQKLDFYLGEY